MDNLLIWNVYNLVRTVPDGVVTTVCCEIFLIDGEYKVGGNINQDVPYKDPSDPNFVPFDNLTEAEVIQWVQNEMGYEKIQKIEREFRKSLEAKKVQKVEGLPW